jgi:Ca2+-binding RTX toxin-like protein
MPQIKYIYEKVIKNTICWQKEEKIMVNINPLLTGIKLTGTTISYSFAPDISNGIKNNVINILNNIIAPTINVNFTEVPFIPIGNFKGQIHYQLVNNPEPYYASASSSASGGVVSFDSDYDNNNNSNGFRGGTGTHGFMSIIHETLHVLGLKHPGNYNNGGGGTAGLYLPYAEDNTTNTVMSYNFAGNSASSLMPYDILALQQLYGARTYNQGNTNYSFNSVYGFSDGTRYWGSVPTLLDLGVPTKVTIWDNGGIDTLDFSLLPFNNGGYRFDVNAGGILTTNSAFNGSSYQAKDDALPGGQTNLLLPYQTTTFGTRIAYNVTIENVIGSSSNDNIFGNNAANFYQGGNGNDFLGGWSGNDLLYGDGGNDILYGDSGLDTLDGGSGNDLLFGHTNNQDVINILGTDNNPDYLYGGTGNDTAYGGNGNDKLYGGSGNDLLYGEGGNDSLYGDSGVDTLDGGTGSDYMIGGTGNDTYIVDSIGDQIVENPPGGGFLIILEIDSVQSSSSYTLPNHVENLTLLGTANFNGEGNELYNFLRGNTGNNILGGFGGDDLIYGGSGNDNLYGDAGNDSLYGESGSDYIDGGTGNDYMEGGTGNDTYRVDSVDDRVVEFFFVIVGEVATSGGIDTVQSSIDYDLPANVENLTFVNNFNIDSIGNALNNRLQGNSGNNFLSGLGGNDNLIGGLGNDVLRGGEGNDILEGGEGDDNLNGEAGNDILNGGAGLDVLSVEGNFNYTLSNTQFIGEGTDTLASIEGANLFGGSGNNIFNTTAFTIGDVILYGGTGNDRLSAGAREDLLYGEEGMDTLSGGAGNDYMDGGTGNDSLIGEQGNDYLQGGEGNDMLLGSDGNDAFDGGAGNDTINGGAGHDVLSVSGDVNYTLNNTQLIGQGTDTLISIEGAALFGGSSNNIFNTTAFTIGDVILYGGAGNDRLSTGVKDDLLYGEEGFDTLSGDAGSDYLYGGTENDSLMAGLGNDFLAGDMGNDTLLGGQGTDNLEGGDGSDLFSFGAPTEGIDDIFDFASGIDKIRISAAGFGGGLGAGLLPNIQFVLGTNALDGADRFIYNQGTGALFFDRDGTGAIAQVQFATLSNFSALSSSDILVV